MLKIILKNLKMHKGKNSLIIIQFSIVFLAFLVSLSLLDSMLTHKKQIENIIDLNLIQLNTEVNDDFTEEMTEDITEECSDLDSKIINGKLEQIRKNTDAKIGIMERIQVYEKDNEISTRVIMANRDFLEMLKFKPVQGTMNQLIEYKGEEVVPILISESLKNKYEINKTYDWEYLDDNDSTKKVKVKVVAIVPDENGMFNGNSTYITETFNNGEDFVILPQITDFSMEALQYNVLIGIKNNLKNNLDKVFSKIEKVYENVGITVGYKTLQQQIEEYYKTQKVVVVLTLGFAVIITVLSILGCIGTTMANIVLRKKEFGIYYSMEMPKRKLLAMIMGEGIILLTISFLVSVILGIIATMTILSGELSIQPRSMAVVIIIMIICVVFSQWMPVRKISKIEPIELISERGNE